MVLDYIIHLSFIFRFRDGRIDQTPLATRCNDAQSFRYHARRVAQTDIYYSCIIIERQQQRSEAITLTDFERRWQAYDRRTLRRRIYHLCTCRTYDLVSHSHAINSPFHFIFLQLRRAQQHHSRIHIYYCFFFSINDRTFQRVRGEETFLLTIIHRVTLLRPNANRRIEGRASEGVRPPTNLLTPSLLAPFITSYYLIYMLLQSDNGNEI